MKKLILLAALIAATFKVKAQGYTVQYITTVTDSGIVDYQGTENVEGETTEVKRFRADTCKHTWISQKNLDTMELVMCMAAHDARGCPDKWLKEDRVCPICHRQEHIEEVRTLVEPAPTPSYEDVINEINSEN